MTPPPPTHRWWVQGQWNKQQLCCKSKLPTSFYSKFLNYFMWTERIHRKTFISEQNPCSSAALTDKLFIYEFMLKDLVKCRDSTVLSKKFIKKNIPRMHLSCHSSQYYLKQIKRIKANVGIQFPCSYKMWFIWKAQRPRPLHHSWPPTFI